MTDTTSTEEPFDLAPAKAAQLVGMSVDSLARLAQSGRLPSMKTPGGHRRYRRSDVLGLLQPEVTS